MFLWCMRIFYAFACRSFGWRLRSENFTSALARAKEKWNILIYLAGSDSYIFMHMSSVRPFVPTFQNHTKTQVFTADWTVELAEWIINDLCLDLYFFHLNLFCSYNLRWSGILKVTYWWVHIYLTHTRYSLLRCIIRDVKSVLWAIVHQMVGQK